MRRGEIEGYMEQKSVHMARKLTPSSQFPRDRVLFSVDSHLSLEHQRTSMRYMAENYCMSTQ